MKFFQAFLLLTLVSCAHNSSPQLQGPLSIVQGLTTPTQAQFSVVAPKANSLKYMVAPTQASEESSTKIVVERFSRPHSEWAVDKFTIKGLDLNKSYWLLIYNDQGNEIDRREFKPLALDSKKFRFVAASCMDDRFTAEQAKMWKQVLQTQPDMLFFIGDNVYADRGPAPRGETPPNQIWDRYVETRNALEVFKAKKLIPTLAIWDDHDYGLNNGGRDYKYKKESAQIFGVFYAQAPLKGVLEEGPGVSSLFRAFGQNFAFLDNRSFRSPKGSMDQTHWGMKQESWLIHRLSRLRKPTWIINGDQIFGAYHSFESYAGLHKKSLNKMLAQFKKLPAPLLFLTGDRHLFEAMKIPKAKLGYPTFEFTTSGVHAKLYPSSWPQKPNPYQIKGVAEKFNFLLIESQALPKGLNFRVQSLSLGAEVIFDKTFSLRKAKGPLQH